MDDALNKDDCLHFWQDHDHSGTWHQWHDSWELPGRWLDHPALVCIAEVFNVAILVVSVVHGKLDMYHFVHGLRKDGRVFPLALVHGNFEFIQVREGYYWPSSRLSIKPSRPFPHTLVGGMLRQRHARVDASTAALQLVGGGADVADDDGVGRDEFSEGYVSK
jgi:hypothetical protein